MNKYKIEARHIHTGETKYVIRNTDLHGWFAGYNFMGGVEWETDILSAYYMEIDEAIQIEKDLESADEEYNPSPAPVRITLSFTPEDINALRKYMYVDPGKHDEHIEEALTNCIWEMIEKYKEE